MIQTTIVQLNGLTNAFNIDISFFLFLFVLHLEMIEEK